MNKQNLIIQKVIEQRFLPLFYHDDVDTCIEVTRALYKAGVRCVEFTNRGSKALKNFSALVKEKNNSMPEMYLGIGTIKSGEEAILFINEGADFLVSPIFDKGICGVANFNKVPWIPGCMTVTEIDNAQKNGCLLIKLFPGNVLGPGFVEAIMPLFSGVNFIVTGGVDTTTENLYPWFKSGVAGVGLGSKLVTATILQNKNYDDLIIKTTELKAIIESIKILLNNHFIK